MTGTRIIFDFIKVGHPLGQIITREEVPSLASRLRRRLEMSESELDFSPTSLKRLENKLFELSQMTQTQNYSDEEIIQFIREIAAYVGEVLVLHADGKWRSLQDLWSTQVIFEGDIKITKEGRQRVAPSVVFSLGNIGAGVWDMISIGRKPHLYKDYLSGKKKKVKEELKTKKR